MVEACHDLQGNPGQVIDELQQEQRVSSGALKVQFDLDGDYLEALTEERVYAKKPGASSGAPNGRNVEFQNLGWDRIRMLGIGHFPIRSRRVLVPAV